MQNENMKDVGMTENAVELFQDTLRETTFSEKLNCEWALLVIKALLQRTQQIYLVHALIICIPMHLSDVFCSQIEVFLYACTASIYKVKSAIEVLRPLSSVNYECAS